jgi:IPT/TIG domain
MRDRTTPRTRVSRSGRALLTRARALIAGHDELGTTMDARRQDESGAVLILALVFLLAVSLIVTGLLTFVGTSLNDTGTYSTDRYVQNAATDAVNLAISNTRYSFDPYSLLNAATPQSCLSPNYPVANETTSIAVYCSMVWQPNNANGYTRTITYSACISGATVTATSCAATPLLQAIVAFDDNPPGSAPLTTNPPQCTSIQNGGNCGETMTQLSWQWSPAVPTVSPNPGAVSPSSGPTAGGTTITITGSGFVSDMTVNFLWESGGTPVSPSPTGYNPVIPATIVTNPPPSCALPTCVQVTTPSVINGATYFVTVTTPGGTSAFSTSAVFSYSTSKPVVAGLGGAVTGGSVTGGNTVTIEGTGFWSAGSSAPALVSFCPTSGGTCQASPSNSTSGVVVTNGSPYQTITALSPSVGPSGVGTYQIRVEVNGQQSDLTSVAAAGSGLSAPVFTYNVLVPIVTSVTPAPPATVAVGGSITINGYNFVTGVTVGFCPVTNTAPYYSTSCVGSGLGGQNMVTSSNINIVTTTQMNVNVPSSLTPGTTYYPIVGVSPYTGAVQPGNPFNEPADEFIYS